MTNPRPGGASWVIANCLRGIPFSFRHRGVVFDRCRGLRFLDELGGGLKVLRGADFVYQEQKGFFEQFTKLFPRQVEEQYSA